jgi:peptidyl-Lys metalloendopeptidase
VIGRPSISVTALTGQAYTFHCDCTKVDVFAYVHADQPYDVFLCGSFWNASLSGLDSQSGTLLHETSHFSVVAGTEDHVYGETEAQKLARTNPDEALTNADNFEYFAESLP